MKSLSRRRAILAGASTAAVVAAASVPVVAAAMPGDPDQCFCDWFKAYLVAEHEQLEATNAAELVWFEKVKHELPPMPEGLSHEYGFWPGEQWHRFVAEDASNIADLEDRADFLSECEAYKAACLPIMEAHDLPRLWAIAAEASERESGFSELLIRTPAQSLVGIVVKLRFLVRYEELNGGQPTAAAYEYSEDSEDSRLEMSAWADAERLSGLPYDAAPWRFVSKGSQS